MAGDAGEDQSARRSCPFLEDKSEERIAGYLFSILPSVLASILPSVILFSIFFSILSPPFLGLSVHPLTAKPITKAQKRTATILTTRLMIAPNCKTRMDKHS